MVTMGLVWEVPRPNSAVPGCVCRTVWWSYNPIVLMRSSYYSCSFCWAWLWSGFMCVVWGTVPDHMKVYNPLQLNISGGFKNMKSVLPPLGTIKFFIGGSRGCKGCPIPSGPKILIFMEFSEKMVHLGVGASWIHHCSWPYFLSSIALLAPSLISFWTYLPCSVLTRNTKVCINTYSCK